MRFLFYTYLVLSRTNIVYHIKQYYNKKYNLNNNITNINISNNEKK